jgi:hypothetical protein
LSENIKTTSPEELSPGEVWDILEFAQSLGGGNLWNVLNPMLVNQRMKEINSSPIAATENTLRQAMADPKNSELALQAFSQDFEIQSQVYRKLLSFLGNILDFGLSYSCINAKPQDYKSSAYSKDLDEVKRFFDSFDYKHEFSIAVKEMLRNEAFFCLPRTDMGKMVLQELPASPMYTMITGRWEHGLLFSMNLYWLILPGVDIQMYPPFFLEKYNNFWKSANGRYNPGADVELGRGSSNWVFWQDIPVDVGWCFKFEPQSITRLPRLTGMFLDLIQQPLMRALQKDINISAAARLIMGQVGTLKDAQAKLKDQFNISPALLGNFLALLKSGIGDAVKAVAAPLDGLQAVSFPAINDLYSSFLKTSLSTSGVSTSLVFDEGTNRTNAVQIQLSLNNDENDLTALYPQFESFLNYQVNKHTKKFKFKFTFDGTQFFNNRQMRLDTQMTLVDKGIVLPTRISSALSMNPFDFQRQLEEAQATGWVDKLTPIVSAFQQSSKEDAGRPKKSDSTLSDEGAQTRGDASNAGRGGKSPS